MSQFKNLLDLLKTCPTEQTCIDYFKERRWKGKIISPFDSTSPVYKCVNNRYKCKNTGKYFNVKTGTIFENSKIPLKTCLYALYVFSNNKKRISSCQLAKSIGITQKSSWYLLQHLCCASNFSMFKTMLKDF